MKRRILLLGIICILLSVFSSCSSSGDPSSVVTAFYKAGNSGDYDKAKSYFLTSSQMGMDFLSPTGMTFERGIDGATKNGTITRIEVNGGDNMGEYAIVYATIFYKDGTQAKDSLQLLKASGGWKIYLSTLVLTGQSMDSSPFSPVK